MKQRLLVLQLLAGFAGAVLLSAQEETAPPAPDRLPADWWTYFAPGEPLEDDERAQRIETAREALEEMLAKMEPERREEFRPRVERLVGSLERYAQVEARAPPAPLNQPPPAPTYTLDAALDRFREWRRLDLEVRAGREELEWQRSLLEQSRRRQIKERASYLERNPQDPERFGEGLALTIRRAELETKEQELARQRRALEFQEEALSDLETELDLIPKRLQTDTATLEQWRERLEEARNDLGEGRRPESEPDPFAGDEPVDESLAPLVARRAVLGDTLREWETALGELTALRADLAVSFLEQLTRPGERDWTEVTLLLETLRERTKDWETFEERTTRVIARTRSTVSEQLAATPVEESSRELLQSTLALANAVDQAHRTFELEHSLTGFLASLAEHQRNRDRGWVGQASAQTRGFAARAWDRFVGALRFTLFEVNETPVNALGLLRIAFILAAALWISKLLRQALERFGQRRNRVNRTSLYTLERIIHYVILGVGIMVGLSSLGLDLTKFALFASALGVGLGFGLQNVVSNFVAGLIILFEKSLNAGDFVELESGVAGEVREINMRSTLVTTNDNVDILVPNSEFVSGRVTNWTLREALRRVHVPFGVAYGSDKDLVRKAALEAASRLPWTLSSETTRRKPQVWLVGFGDSSLDFELVVWLTPEAVKRPARVQADFLWEIETSLGEHGIEIPFPQRDLHLRSGFEPSGRTSLPNP